MRTMASLVLAVIVTISWMWNPGKEPRFEGMSHVPIVEGKTLRGDIYGDAMKPACGRILTLYTMRAANELCPKNINDMLVSMSEMAPLNQMRLDKSIMPAYAAVGAMSLTSFIILGITCGPFALLLAWAALSYWCGTYDPVTLATFGAAYWAIANNRRPVFWAAFIVAALNRETAPMLLLLWAISGGGARPAIIALVAWAAFRATVVYVYRDNDLWMLWYTLERNIKMIAPISATSLFSAMFGGVVIIRGLRDMPQWARWSYWAFAAILLPSTIMWGQPERLRTFIEIIPMSGVAIEAGLRSIVWSKDAGAAIR